jgi:pSer/pThr/pTyr-binding forkhead associated (FHA) protein
MQVRLLERGGSAEQTREISVSGPEFLIGRGIDCDLRVRESAVSRHHCILRTAGDGVTLIDLGSRNGSFVNGQRVVSQAPLHNGDRLQLGSREFVVDLGDDAAGLGVTDVDPLAATIKVPKRSGPAPSKPGG